jgi:hypothetical protein
MMKDIGTRRRKAMGEKIKIRDDERPITAIYFDGSQYEGYCVGRNGITDIKCYLEDGMYSDLTWFCVYSGETIKARVNFNMVAEVRYA